MRLFLAIVSILTLLSTATAEEKLVVKTFGQPVLLTSAGQAMEVLMVKGLCTRGDTVNAKYRPFATADSISDVKAVIVVPGGSAKGLGAAKGVSIESEEARVTKLLAGAVKAKLPVVMVHLGRDGRRGPKSDPLIKLAGASANVIVVEKGGDDDGLMKGIAEKNKARYIVIENTAALIGVFKEIFPKSPPVKPAG